MNTEQLKYFLSIAKHKSFTGAARDFYMTQPAISHQIAELEKEVGIRLLNRTTRTVTLTRAGELFLEDAKKILSLQDETLHKFSILKTSGAVSLTIGYLSGPCKDFLPELIYRFRQIHPQTDVRLKRYNTLDIQTSMAKKECDIYFSLKEDLTKDKSYESRTLFNDPFCLVCRKDHPCMFGEHIDLDKIATEPFLIIDEIKAACTDKMIFEICRFLNFSPRITGRYATMEELLFATESGLGITILPYKMKNYLQTNLAYILLDTPITSNISVAWQRNENPAIRWLLTLLNHELMPNRLT